MTLTGPYNRTCGFGLCCDYFGNLSYLTCQRWLLIFMSGNEGFSVLSALNDHLLEIQSADLSMCFGIYLTVCASVLSQALGKQQWIIYADMLPAPDGACSLRISPPLTFRVCGKSASSSKWRIKSLSSSHCIQSKSFLLQAVCVLSPCHSIFCNNDRGILRNILKVIQV